MWGFGEIYPSSSLRCSRKRPSLLSLACASGRLSFAVRERYYYVYFISAISFHVRTYADASFHITIQARSTNTRFTYVQSSTFVVPYIFGAKAHANVLKGFSTEGRPIPTFPGHKLIMSIYKFFFSTDRKTNFQKLGDQFPTSSGQKLMRTY